MANIRKDISDYRKLAKERGLKFIMEFAPYRVRESIDWECLNCHRIVHTSFSNLQIADHGCMCQIGATNDEQKYHDLAERFCLRWIGERLPLNVKEATRWYSILTETEFEASYSDIGYSSVKSRFRKYICERAMA